MHLTEGTHFETVVYEAGTFTRNEYCAYVADQRAFVLRITHPDVDHEDIRQMGEYMSRARKALSKRELDRRRQNTDT